MNVGMSISGPTKRLRTAPSPVSSAYASAGPGDRRRGGPGTLPEGSSGAVAHDPMSLDWAPRPVDKGAQQQRKRAQGTAPIVVAAKRRSMAGGSRRTSANGEGDLTLSGDSAPPVKSEGAPQGPGEKVRYLSSLQRGPSEALGAVKEENKPSMRMPPKNHRSSISDNDSRDPSHSAEDGEDGDGDFDSGEGSDGGDGDDRDAGDAASDAKLARLAKAGNNLEAKTNDYRKVSRRPRLDDCTEEDFEEDYLLFHKITGRGAPLSKVGKANGIRLDLFQLYKQTCFYGGFVRTGNGSGINWAGQVFPNMKNFTHGNKATSIGNQLIQTYSKFLVEYEQANQQDLDSNNCKICHQEMAPDSLEQWIACVKCEGWFHYCCVNCIEEHKIRPNTIAAKIYSFKQHEKQKGPEYTCTACLLGRQAVRSMGSYHQQPHQQQQQQQQPPLQRSASLNNPSVAPRNPSSAPRPPSAAPRPPTAAPSAPRGPSQAPRQPPTAPRTSLSEAPRQPQHGGASRPLPQESRAAAAAAGGGGGAPSAAPRNPSNPPAASSADHHAPPRGNSSSSSGPSAPQPSQQPPQIPKVSVKVKMKEAPLRGGMGGPARPRAPALASGTGGTGGGGSGGGGGGGPNGSGGAAVPDLAAMQKTRAKVKAAIKEDKIFSQLSDDGFDLTFSHFTSHAPGSGSSRAIVRMEPRDKAGLAVQQEVLARARRYASQDNEEAMRRFEESYVAVTEAMQAAAAKQVQEPLKRIAEKVSRESPGMAVRVRVIQGSSAVEAVVEAAPDGKGPPAAAPGSSS